MLGLPNKGFSRSIYEHRVKLDCLADWIEASVLFSEFGEVSKADAIDILVDEQIYNDQSFCSEIISDAWLEFKRRNRSIGERYPFIIDANRIIRKHGNWTFSPSYSFCLLLALPNLYDWWVERFGRDYNEQGVLFEKLTFESLQIQFPDWEFYLSGWSQNNTIKIEQVVDEIVSRLHEPKGDIEPWVSKNANEAGLDILGYRPFPDERVAIPIYLMQCASGVGYKNKVDQPKMRIWKKVIEFTITPQKAFAIPFSLLDEDFLDISNLVDGLFLDRSRLMSVGDGSEFWESDELRDRIEAWASVRIANLDYL